VSIHIPSHTCTHTHMHTRMRTHHSTHHSTLSHVCTQTPRPKQWMQCVANVLQTASLMRACVANVLQTASLMRACVANVLQTASLMRACVANVLQTASLMRASIGRCSNTENRCMHPSAITRENTLVRRGVVHGQVGHLPSTDLLLSPFLHPPPPRALSSFLRV
jgi:hypothetical protein